MLNNFIFLVITQNEAVNEPAMNWSLNFSTLGQFFFLIIIFISVIFAAYYFTRLIGGVRLGKNNNIVLIESISLGFQNVVHLLKVGDEYFLIGTSKDGIRYLTEVNKDSVTLENYPVRNKIDFSFEHQLQRVIKKFAVDKNHKNSDGDEKE